MFYIVNDGVVDSKHAERYGSASLEPPNLTPVPLLLFARRAVQAHAWIEFRPRIKYTFDGKPVKPYGLTLFGADGEIGYAVSTHKKPRLFLFAVCFHEWRLKRRYVGLRSTHEQHECTKCPVTREDTI